MLTLICWLIGIGLCIWPGVPLFFLFVYLGLKLYFDLECSFSRGKWEKQERKAAKQARKQAQAEAARRDALRPPEAERAIASLRQFDDALVSKIHELRVDERALRASIKATLGDSHDF